MKILAIDGHDRVCISWHDQWRLRFCLSDTEVYLHQALNWQHINLSHDSWLVNPLKCGFGIPCARSILSAYSSDVDALTVDCTCSCCYLIVDTCVLMTSSIVHIYCIMCIRCGESSFMHRTSRLACKLNYIDSQLSLSFIFICFLLTSDVLPLKGNMHICTGRDTNASIAVVTSFLMLMLVFVCCRYGTELVTTFCIC